MNFWVARDDYGLWFFVNKPTKTIINGDKYFVKHGNVRYSIDSRLFPELTFENSPREIELKPKNELSFEEIEELIDDLI